MSKHKKGETFKKTCPICKEEFLTQRLNQICCSKLCTYARYNQVVRRQSAYPVDSVTAGAISQIEISSILMKKQYSVFQAISPGCFCDLLATKKDENKIYRIEARTGYASSSTGKITFPRKTHGKIDLFGVYIPSTDEVKFFDTKFQEVNLW